MKLMFNIYMTINIIMNLKVIITFSLLFFICNIFAQNDLSTWTLIKKAEQTEIYADFKGLKKSGNMSTIWLLENYSQAKTDRFKRWYSTRAEYEVDCPGKMSKLIQIILHNGNMGNGTIVRARLATSDWLNMKDDIYSAVCNI